MDDIQQERTKFEEWARTNKHPEGGYKLAKTASGTYINPDTRCAWRGWVARAEQPETGHCSEGRLCACGGDLPRVRETCSSWVK